MHEGWTKLEDMRSVTQNFIHKIEQNPGFRKQIQVAEGWDYSWDNYFSGRPAKKKSDTRLLDDLEKILSIRNCYQKIGETYVSFHGE